MAEEKKQFKYIIRVANTDLDGKKTIYQALRKIKGVDFMFSNAVCNKIGLDKNMIAGKLDDDNITKLDEIIRNPNKFNLPIWLFNRRIDPLDGIDKHQ